MPLSDKPTYQDLARAFDFNDDPLSSGAGASEGIMSGSEGASDPSVARVGAFSDGVFAFAITLMILAIRIPHRTDADAGLGLLKLLTQQWTGYLAFVLSFIFVGMNWSNHRVMFSKFVRTNHTLIWLNLLYLMVGVAFIPIPTAVLGEWIGSPANQLTAALFYGGAATVGGLAFNVIWWYGAYASKLTSPELSARERRAHTVAWAPAPFVMATLTAVAFLSPPLAVAGYLTTGVVYILPVPALIGLKQRRHRVRSGRGI